MSEENTVYDPVRRCIYCGHDGKGINLGKEHIIPLSLGGTFLLPRSTCPSCTKITQSSEFVCARDMFGDYRIIGDLPSRDKSQRPNELPIKTHTGSKSVRESIMLAVDQHPFLAFVMPEIGVPRVLTGDSSTDEFTIYPRMLLLTRNTEISEKTKAQGKRFEYERNIRITEFARLLAKIAHSFAVAALGYGTFEPLLPPLILQQANNLPDYVGGLKPLEKWYPPFYGEEGVAPGYLIQHAMHLQDVAATDGTIYLTALINLLQFSTPTYRVVVAKSPRYSHV
jgi:hypothetical protein